MFERLFKLSENRTNKRTEITAGITSFMTVSYILALAPNILTNFKTEGGQELWNAIFMATCIASAIGMICVALIANKPFIIGPGIGPNTFFAFVCANIAAMTGMSYIESYQTVLCIVLFEGIIFIIFSVLSVRDKILDAIPLPVRTAIAPAIGMMLINIGLGSNCGVRAEDGRTFYVLRDFFGSLTPSFAKANMGDAYASVVLNCIVVLVGFFVILILSLKGFKFSVIAGILVSSVFYWIMEFIMFRRNPFEVLFTSSWKPPVKDLVNITLFKFNFHGLMQIGWLSFITLLITFCLMDMFSIIGTLVGVADKVGMIDSNGKMKDTARPLLANSIGIVSGAASGTSTLVTFVESAAGIGAGGRTGLTSLTTGIIMLMCMFISPIAAVIPAPATSAALVYTGVLMVSDLRRINFADIASFVPTALMLLAMPVSGSIGDAIGLGMISYTIIQTFLGRYRKISVITYIISAIFLVKFFLIV